MPHLLRAVALAIISLAVAIACVPAPSPSPTPTAERTRAPTPTAKPAPTPEPRTHNTPTPVAQVPADIRVMDVVAGEVQVPIALTFAPDGRLFFNEVSKGMVRILRADWTLQPEPFVTLPISRRAE